MKANEFVKKHGWDDASALVDASRLCGIDKSIVDIDDLKILVASWELVDSFGGLSYAERFLNENVPCIDSVRLEKAIADVESCQ